MKLNESTSFSRALAWAAQLHVDQRRKGTDIPYIAHLLSVAALVIEDGGSEDEAIAALLHDSIEDQGVTADAIAADFGPRVAAIVVECSDATVHPKPPWRGRKELYIQHLEAASPEAVRVSLADKLHNVRSILTDYKLIGDELWSRFNAPVDDQIWYYSLLATTFEQVSSSPMVALLRETVDEVVRLVHGPSVVRATFTCEACGQVAATVTYIPPYYSDPRFEPPLPPDVPEGLGRLGEEHARLSIDGGPVPITFGLIDPATLEPVLSALHAGDAGRLSAVDSEYANFYCRRCKANYCDLHWETEVVIDEGFYDCTYGTCPKGHRSIIND